MTVSMDAEIGGAPLNWEELGRALLHELHLQRMCLSSIYSLRIEREECAEEIIYQKLNRVLNRRSVKMSDIIVWSYLILRTLSL